MKVAFVLEVHDESPIAKDNQLRQEVAQELLDIYGSLSIACCVLDDSFRAEAYHRLCNLKTDDVQHRPVVLSGTSLSQLYKAVMAGFDVPA